ncbi:MAG: T9SS type A sorting domain-containing protein, partial [Hymenobacter sp.]
TVLQPNPVPTLASLSPSTVVAGSPAFTLTLSGTGFIAGSVVNLAGADLPTTYVSATQLTVAVPASAVAVAGSYGVTVASPAPGGGTSGTLTLVVTTPAPSITSFSPLSGPVGTAVTVVGTNFSGATAVTLNGAAVGSFTVASATTISFVVPAGAASGFIAVTTPGGTATSGAAFTVINPNPVPTITSLSPASAVAGSGALTLVITGTGFLSNSVVSFAGISLPTTYASATQLTAQVSASLLTTTGSYNVLVTNPTPGGGASVTAVFTVTAPAPALLSFTPASGLVGATITVTGTNLTGATTLTLNGVSVGSFAVVNATTLTFVVPAGATSGLVAVTTPGGTATSASAFTVLQPNPVPTLASLSPSTVVAGSPAFTLTLSGTGFITGSVVRFNATALATTYVSATQLTAVLPASALATAGSYEVLVSNATPGGGSSAALPFVVTVPAPTISSFTPTAGGSGTLLTITGTNLTGATEVRIGTTLIPTFTVVSATSLTLVVPANSGVVSGFITVTTPGGTATSATAFGGVLATAGSQALPELQVYPNPFKSKLTIVLPGSGVAQVSLYDVAGRLVLPLAPLPATGQLQLPDDLATGVYLLEVRQGTAIMRRSLVKQ